MMTPDSILATLRGYDAELAAILTRFSHVNDGLHINLNDNYRLRTLVMESIDLLQDHVPDSGTAVQMLTNSYNLGIQNYVGTSSYASVEEVRGLLSSVATRISRNPRLFDTESGPITLTRDSQSLLDALDTTIRRFHGIAMQLRSRHGNRPTLDVSDEYDVQDLLHALLRMNFDDVRAEEWVPSYAGSASRTDFLLPVIGTVIEVKRTRPGLSAKALGEQLIIDIARYAKHPQCQRLICFVYDPEGRIPNPVGIENDLNSQATGIDVRVAILPRAA